MSKMLLVLVQEHKAIQILDIKKFNQLIDLLEINLTNNLENKKVVQLVEMFNSIMISINNLKMRLNGINNF